MFLPMKTLEQARADLDREYLITLMVACGWKVIHAAEIAGMNRSHFYRILKQHRIVP